MFKVFNKSQRIQINESSDTPSSSQPKLLSKRNSLNRHSQFFDVDPDTTSLGGGTLNSKMLSSKKYVSCENVRHMPAEDFQEVIEESDDYDDDGIKDKLKKHYSSLTTLLMRSFRKAKNKKKKEAFYNGPVLETNYEESTAVYQPTVIQPSTSRASIDPIPKPRKVETPSLVRKELNNEKRSSRIIPLEQNQRNNRAVTPVEEKRAARTVQQPAESKRASRLIDEQPRTINKAAASKLSKVAAPIATSDDDANNEEGEEEEANNESMPVFLGLKPISNEFVDLKPASPKKTSNKDLEIELKLRSIRDMKSSMDKQIKSNNENYDDLTLVEQDYSDDDDDLNTLSDKSELKTNEANEIYEKITKILNNDEATIKNSIKKSNEIKLKKKETAGASSISFDNILNKKKNNEDMMMRSTISERDSAGALNETVRKTKSLLTNNLADDKSKNVSANSLHRFKSHSKPQAPRIPDSVANLNKTKPEATAKPETAPKEAIYSTVIKISHNLEEMSKVNKENELELEPKKAANVKRSFTKQLQDMLKDHKKINEDCCFEANEEISSAEASSSKETRKSFLEESQSEKALNYHKSSTEPKTNNKNEPSSSRESKNLFDYNMEYIDHLKKLNDLNRMTKFSDDEEALDFKFKKQGLIDLNDINTKSNDFYQSHLTSKLYDTFKEAETNNSDDFKDLVNVLARQDEQFKRKFFDCLMTKLWDTKLPYSEYMQLNKLMTALFGESYHKLDINFNSRRNTSKLDAEHIVNLMKSYLETKSDLSNTSPYKKTTQEDLNELSYSTIGNLINTLKRRQKSEEVELENLAAKIDNENFINGLTNKNVYYNPTKSNDFLYASPVEKLSPTIPITTEIKVNTSLNTNAANDESSSNALNDLNIKNHLLYLNSRINDKSRSSLLLELNNNKEEDSVEKFLYSSAISRSQVLDKSSDDDPVAFVRNRLRQTVGKLYGNSSSSTTSNSTAAFNKHINSLNSIYTPKQSSINLNQLVKQLNSTTNLNDQLNTVKSSLYETFSKNTKIYTSANSASNGTKSSGIIASFQPPSNAHTITTSTSQSSTNNLSGSGTYSKRNTAIMLSNPKKDEKKRDLSIGKIFRDQNPICLTVKTPVQPPKPKLIESINGSKIDKALLQRKLQEIKNKEGIYQQQAKNDGSSPSNFRNIECSTIDRKKYTSSNVVLEKFNTMKYTQIGKKRLFSSTMASAKEANKLETKPLPNQLYKASYKKTLQDSNEIYNSTNALFNAGVYSKSGMNDKFIKFDGGNEVQYQTKKKLSDLNFEKDIFNSIYELTKNAKQIDSVRQKPQPIINSKSNYNHQLNELMAHKIYKLDKKEMQQAFY